MNSALTHPDWYLVAPAYPVSDKGGHLDANGYRWLGNYFGKVMHRVITLGQKWLPLYPTQITYCDTSILVDFHVPFAPLVFDGPLVGNFNTSLVPVVYPSKGFAIFDDIGEVPIASVAIVSDTGVLITPTRALSTNPWLRYAGNETYAGNGNLRDSDPTTALDVYCYTASSGQYPVEDIPALVGNPYPLYNWCCAFNMPIVAG